MHSPNVTQLPIAPIDGSAQVKSPSHGRASEPEPDELERAVERALACVDPRPRLGDDDAGDQLRQEEGGGEEAKAADRRAGERRGEQQAEITGSTA